MTCLQLCVFSNLWHLPVPAGISEYFFRSRLTLSKCVFSLLISAGSWRIRNWTAVKTSVNGIHSFSWSVKYKIPLSSLTILDSKSLATVLGSRTLSVQRLAVFRITGLEEGQRTSVRNRTSPYKHMYFDNSDTSSFSLELNAQVRSA